MSNKHGVFVRYTRACLLIACLLGASMGVQAAEGGTLRERLRERLAERRQAAEDKSANADAGTSRTAQTGDTEGSVQLAGERRKYLMHVPRSYQSQQPAALVLALHGGGGSAEHMADDKVYGLISKSEQAGFVVVFPNGYSKLPGGKFATWNAGGCCGDARDRQIDDVGFIRALVADVKRQLNIDAGRVYAIGMSNGGMMSHRLACEASDIFRAIAAVAGTDATSNCQPVRPLSVLHIHARDDDHVLFNGGAGPEAFRDPSKVMDFVSVPDTISRWLNREQCSIHPVRTLQTAGAYCETYSGCTAGNKVQLCVTESGGHSWPGGQSSRRGKEAPSSAIRANDVIWDFFSSLPR